MNGEERICRPVLEELGLSQSDIVADIGCGIGYFTISASEIITNKVFALDTSEEMLAEVEKRASVAEVFNIVTIQTDEYDLKLPNESVSFALLVNVLHEIADKQRFIKEIKRILKSNGKLAIIEWEKESMEKGPPIEDRIGKDEVVALLKSDFELNNSMQFAKVFYGLVFILGKCSR